jgi:hypothetical protein
MGGERRRPALFIHLKPTMSIIEITYNTSVCVDAGWRSLEITAEAEQTSDRMATVLQVLRINGETPSGYQSRTGAQRQRFNGLAIARREVGARKRPGSCIVREMA